MSQNPFSKFVVVVNYYLYTFYQRWYPSPSGHAVQVSGFLFTLTIAELGNVFGLLDTPPPGGIYAWLVLIALMMFLNYLVVFRNDKHHESFLAIAHGGLRARKAAFILFWSYFLLTVVPFAVFIVVRVSRLK